MQSSVVVLKQHPPVCQKQLAYLSYPGLQGKNQGSTLEPVLRMHRVMLEQKIGFISNNIDQELEFGDFMLNRIDEVDELRVRKKRSVMKPPSNKELHRVIKKPQEPILKSVYTADLMSAADYDDDQSSEVQEVAPKNYCFGPQAKDDFWTLFKSGRAFKDMNLNKTVDDPRLAYITMCQEQKILPRAGMLVRQEATNHLDYSHFGLVNKSSLALSQAIKRFNFPYESADFSYNGLKGKESAELLRSLKCDSLRILSLAKNKIGLQGAECLAELIPDMKNLKELYIQENQIGDTGLLAVLKALENSTLVRLDLSSNGLCKTPAVGMECAQALYNLFFRTQHLAYLNLSWNHIRWEMGARILEGLEDNVSLLEMDLAYNLLGEHKGGETPAAQIGIMLIRNDTLKHLDISYNMIDSKAIFCIANAFKSNNTLESIIVNGNPIGHAGQRYLMQAINRNNNFNNVEMKQVSTGINPAQKGMFDPNSPQGLYRIDMMGVYDRVILQNLLDIDEKVVQSLNDQEIERGVCFQDAKLGSAAWTVPSEKDKYNMWEIEESDKELTFNFKIPGKSQNKMESAMTDMRPIIEHSALKRYGEILLERRELDDGDGQVELIQNLTKEYKFFAIQARQLLLGFRDTDALQKAASQFFWNILDRHNRFLLLEPLPLQNRRHVRKKLGQLYEFSPPNPTGHYRLNLTNPFEKQLAKHLLELNKKGNALMESGELADRSQQGNKSFLRNQSLNQSNFIWTPEWQMPAQGILEFDFVYLISPPSEQLVMVKDQFQKLLASLKNLETSYVGKIRAFKSIAQQIALNSDQLTQILDLSEEPAWKVEIFLIGVGRLCDIENYDFIKHRVKFPDAIKAIYSRFGILNLFNPHRPNGSYRLDLQLYEERTVLNLLLDLARQEGIDQFTNTTLNEHAVELTKEYEIPQQGIFEGTYICDAANANKTLRDELGKKYLDWKKQEEQ